ncbi:MAG TPA: hypothetical protein PLV45_12085, partial [bacterium]|nr:hypothetical protein [bacterium]
MEILIKESSRVLTEQYGNQPDTHTRRSIYIAATRMVMRFVVILFAEARDLLPRENAIYHSSYSIQGLREQLAFMAGGRAERLRHSYSAWPRLMALFQLVRDGSSHEALPVMRYGGGLFRKGETAASDAVLNAIAAFENPANTPADSAIHKILELLCISKVKVRQGRSSTWVPAPVDFSDLSSEYIGILYEGLLDFELHRAPVDSAVVFLKMGDEPALPLERLEEEMAPQRLAEIIGKLKKGSQKKSLSEDEDIDTEEDAEDVDEAEDLDSSEEEHDADNLDEDDSDSDDSDLDDDFFDDNENVDDIVRIVRERAQIWAEKAVKEARLVPYPRDDSIPLVRERWQNEVTQKARSLYRLVLPGEWYLVRWGGTRKGAGTFYTRPQLAVPTARRTIQPLVYESVEPTAEDSTDQKMGNNQRPRLPEDILKLKVCDPAMGSGSFLIAALRYITDALVESLHFHKRLIPSKDGTICKLADGLPLDHPKQEILPVPFDHPEFSERLQARLKPYVVERCLYGVDIDPLAVELARMAVWIETMKRDLPFGFIDHKLRCGNSLVGCWFDRFQDFPVMAFERDDAGDKNHTRFVHHVRDHLFLSGKNRGKTEQRGDVWTQKW